MRVNIGPPKKQGARDLIIVVSTIGEIIALCAHVSDALHLAEMYGKDTTLRIDDYVVWWIGEPVEEGRTAHEMVTDRIAWLRDNGLELGQLTVNYGGVVIGRL